MAPQHLANGTKHCVGKPTEFTGGHAIVAVDSELVAYHPIVRMDNGTERRAADIAMDAVNKWIAIFEEHDLKVPSIDDLASNDSA